MTTAELVRELAEHGVGLRLAQDGQLAVRASRGKVDAALLQRIRDNKEALLVWLRAALATTTDDALPSIQHDPDALHEPFPLSDLQMAFVVGEGAGLEHHVRPHYYVETDFERLDTARYIACLNRLLRLQSTSLPLLRPDLQLQIVPEFQPLSVKVTDLTAKSSAEQSAYLAQRRAELSRQELPLQQWPWSSCEISVHSGGVRVHFNNNNFFSDGFGSQTLFNNVLKAYSDPGFEPVAPAISYRDCVLALKKLEDSAMGQRSADYWRERLAGLPLSVALPTRADFVAQSRSKLVRRKLTLPPAQWASIKRSAQQWGLTATNALYSVYAEVLRRFSGQDHFLLNNMVTHRFPMHPDVKNIVGNFASLYPLEVDWRHPEPLYKKAQRLQEQLARDLQHTYWSGVRVLQELNHVQKTPGKAPCPFVVGSGLFMGPVDPPAYSCLETPQVTLDHQFWESSEGGLWAVWDLIEDAFAPGLIDRMWSAYQTSLQTLAAAAERWLDSSWDVLTPAECQQRQSVNRTAVEQAPENLAASLLAMDSKALAQVALADGSTRWTYDELLRRACGICSALAQLGAKTGSRVPVLIDKSTQQVAAVYGILLHGSAYVPVDPKWPDARLREVIDACGANHLVTEHAHTEKAKRLGVPYVVVENTKSLAPSECRLELAEPGALGYVIFTSGSTGRPKGVAVSHDAAMNTVRDVHRRFNVSSADVLLGISSLAFDLSVYDLFGAAAVGAKLVLPAASQGADPGHWLDLVRAHRVTVWNSVPALMQLFAEACATARVVLPHLRLVLLSGDWIPLTLPERIRSIAPNAKIVSLGGATEAAIWSIFHEVESVDPSWRSVPYGKPLANQRWTVLDSELNAVPTLVAGDLYIAGRGLAEGYFGDPERTANSFITHPRTGERLYRTGDVGRYWEDGSLELLGRSDLQVKIQGYRVELGDIEHALCSHSAVQSGVVIAKGAAAGKQLCGFACLKPGCEAEPADVLAHIANKVPSYMVPATLQLLERLPLSSNGKIDRGALGQMATEATSTQEVHVTPATETERRVARIWADVLGRDRIGVTSDFFELGGQSFAALRVVNQIAREFEVTLSLGAVLEARTIRGLARLIEGGARQSPLVRLNEVAAGGGRVALLVHPAGGNVVCYRGLAAALPFATYGLQAVGLQQASAPETSVKQLAEGYVESVLAAGLTGPFVVGGWSSGGIIAHEVTLQLEARGQQVERLVVLDAPAPRKLPEVSAREMLAWFIEDLNIGVTAADVLSMWGEGWDPGKTPEVWRWVSERHPNAPPIEQLQGVLRLFSRIVTACRGHETTRVKAPVYLLRAQLGRVTEFLRHPDDARRDWGWPSFTRADVKIGASPSSHHTLLQEQYLSHVLELFRT